MAVSGRIIREGFEGLDSVAAEEIMTAAHKKANIVNELKRHRNMPSLTRAFDLGGGITCLVSDLSHIKILQVSIPSSYSPDTYEVFTPYVEADTTGVAYVHDILSGRVDSTILKD